MAVIYLFDAAKQLRRPVREGVQEIIHSEGEYEAIAQILAKDAPKNGEHFGFRCMDGLFRMFLIRDVETDDESSTCIITGTDAAVAELEHSIVTELSMQNTTAVKAITGALRGTGWTIGRQTGDGQVNTENAYFATRWAVVKTAAAAGGVRVVPYYEFDGNSITAKKVDVLDKTPVFSGLIYTRKRGAQNIHITREGVPYGRVYPVGKIIGSEEPPEQVTIADAVWSRAKGDPADKPAGQLYIDLPGAISKAEYVFEDKAETDPDKLAQKGFEDLKSRKKAKATGTANISDMERMPGYEHMRVEMWALAVIRAETGESVETTIINVERYYVHTELTKITVGDEDASETALENMLAKMHANLAETARVAGGGRAGAGQAKQMILEAEELIRLNSKKIEANAEQITLRAFSADVVKLADETEVAFREVYLDIDLDRAEIGATKTIVDNINNKVSTMNATLTVQAEKIETKVSKDGVISSINQTAEQIKIQAGKINLSGYVTMSSFEAEIAKIDNIFAGYSEISALGINGNFYAKNANITDNLRIFDHQTEWQEVTLYRGGRISVSGTTNHTVYDLSGNPIGSVRGIPSSWAFSASSDGTYHFLGY